VVEDITSTWPKLTAATTVPVGNGRVIYYSRCLVCELAEKPRWNTYLYGTHLSTTY
jgi:hypothetical protein